MCSSDSQLSNDTSFDSFIPLLKKRSRVVQVGTLDVEKLLGTLQASSYNCNLNKSK